MRYRPGASLFRVRRQYRPANVQIDPAAWRTLHETAARQARAMRDLVSEVSRDTEDAALRLYVAELYRIDVTQLKSGPKRGSN